MRNTGQSVFIPDIVKWFSESYTLWDKNTLSNRVIIAVVNHVTQINNTCMSFFILYATINSKTFGHEMYGEI